MCLWRGGAKRVRVENLAGSAARRASPAPAAAPLTPRFWHGPLQAGKWLNVVIEVLKPLPPPVTGLLGRTYRPAACNVKNGPICPPHAASVGGV